MNPSSKNWVRNGARPKTKTNTAAPQFCCPGCYAMNPGIDAYRTHRDACDAFKTWLANQQALNPPAKQKPAPTLGKVRVRSWF